MTPLSTPPSVVEDAAADTASRIEHGESIASGLLESAVYDKIYET